VIAATAQAESITLRSLDGSVAMTGELVDFDGQNYFLKTMLGDVTILASEVVCEGKCPHLVNVDFRIAGAGSLNNTLVSDVFSGFGSAAGLKLNVIAPEVADVAKYAFIMPDGSDFADVDVHTLGSDAAFKALLDGKAEVVVSTRPVRSDEAAALIAAGLGDPTDAANQIVAGLEGIAVVVSPENPVKALTLDEMGKIFAGRITNWSALGGANKAIRLYRRNDSSTASNDFARMVFANSGLGYAKVARTFDTDAALAAAVASDPDGIGFTGISRNSTTRALAVRGTCGALSEPSEFAVKAGEYPLTQPVVFYTGNVLSNANAQDKAARLDGFLHYLRSPAAQQSVHAAGFIDQSITSLPMDKQGRRLINAILDSQNDATYKRIQKVVSDLADAERLSSTFRFKQGIAQLDAQSVGDIARLADYLRGANLAGKQVVLAGFTNAASTASQNEALSMQRAGQVEAALKEALGKDTAGITLVSVGFGAVAPATCTDTDVGRATNRRVEVWVRSAS